MLIDVILFQILPPFEEYQFVIIKVFMLTFSLLNFSKGKIISRTFEKHLSYFSKYFIGESVINISNKFFNHFHYNNALFKLINTFKIELPV